MAPEKHSIEQLLQRELQVTLSKILQTSRVKNIQGKIFNQIKKLLHK